LRHVLFRDFRQFPAACFVMSRPKNSEIARKTWFVLSARSLASSAERVVFAFAKSRAVRRSGSAWFNQSSPLPEHGMSLLAGLEPEAPSSPRFSSSLCILGPIRSGGVSLLTWKFAAQIDVRQGPFFSRATAWVSPQVVLQELIFFS